MPLGDLQQQLTAQDIMSLVRDATGEMVRQWATIYSSIPETRISEFPFSTNFQQPCHKILRVSTIDFADFALIPFLFYTYNCPYGVNCVINNISVGFTRRTPTVEDLAVFDFFINGVRHPEYQAGAQTVFTLFSQFNLILKPTDILDVYFSLTTLGYTYPGDVAFMVLNGWEYPAKVGSD